MDSNTWASLRQIMYQPSACWLATEYSGDRWLTDQYVLLLVTDYEEFQDVPDGPYQLVASRGAVPGHPKSRDAVPEPDIEAWFQAVADRDWQPAIPTEWSVAEHPGKAMLWVSEQSASLLGESTWTAIKRHYPGVTVEHSFRGNSLFRFGVTYHLNPDDDCMAAQCRCEPSTFAFAAGIRIPDGQEVVAQAIVKTLNSSG